MRNLALVIAGELVATKALCVHLLTRLEVEMRYDRFRYSGPHLIRHVDVEALQFNLGGLVHRSWQLK